jgi:hypothetical protein
MTAYSDVYIGDIMNEQGLVFHDIREALPGVDEKWFIVSYMKSNIRRLLDHANPKFANMPSPELIIYFIDRECDGKYEIGEQWGGFLPSWTGTMYAFYQWRFNVSSAKLVEMLPLSEMERIFPTLHQTDWEVAAQKIHDEVLLK